MFNPNCVYLLGLTCLFSSNSNFIRIVIQIRYISSIHQFFLIFWCSDLFLKLFEIQDGELKLAGSWWRIQDSGQFGIWDVIWLFVALCLACIVITLSKNIRVFYTLSKFYYYWVHRAKPNRQQTECWINISVTVVACYIIHAL